MPESPKSTLSSAKEGVGALVGIIAGIGELIAATGKLPLHGPWLVVLGLILGLFTFLLGFGSLRNSTGARWALAWTGAILGSGLMLFNLMFASLIYIIPQPDIWGIPIGSAHPTSSSPTGTPKMEMTPGAFYVTNTYELSPKWDHSVGPVSLQGDFLIAWVAPISNKGTVVNVDLRSSPGQMQLSMSGTNKAGIRIDRTSPQPLVPITVQIRFDQPYPPQGSSNIMMKIEEKYFLDENGKLGELRTWAHKAYTGSS